MIDDDVRHDHLTEAEARVMYDRLARMASTVRGSERTTRPREAPVDLGTVFETVACGSARRGCSRGWVRPNFNHPPLGQDTRPHRHGSRKAAAWSLRNLRTSSPRCRNQPIRPTRSGDHARQRLDVSGVPCPRAARVAGELDQRVQCLVCVLADRRWDDRAGSRP